SAGAAPRSTPQPWAPPFTAGKRSFARLAPRCPYASRLRDCRVTFRVRATGRGERVPSRRAQVPPHPRQPVRATGEDLQCQGAWCPDHGPLRLRRDRIRPLRGAVGVPHVPPALEHWADSGGGVLGNHAGHAADAHFRDPHRAGLGRPGRGPGGLRRVPAAGAASRRDGLLVRLLHAQVGAAGPGTGPKLSPGATPPRETRTAPGGPPPPPPPP